MSDHRTEASVSESAGKTGGFLLSVCDLLTRFLYKERPKRIVNQRHRVYRYAGEEERVVLAVQAKGVCSVVTDSQ